MSEALGIVISTIEKQFGKGTVQRLTDKASAEPDNVIRSGSIALDSALGVGGYRKGRIVELFGPEMSGKTTLGLHAVVCCQKAGGVAAYIDVEHALDPLYATSLGVDLDSLLVSQPDTAEQALQIADIMARSGEVSLIVLDSVAALVPQKELEGEMGDQHVGLQARLMSQAMRKLTGSLSSSNCTIIFTNQIRMKIGVMFGCFSYRTKIHLADGTTEDIGKIVNQRLPLEVLSYNAETKQIEPKKITKWFDNGTTKEYLQIKSQRAVGNGVNFIEVTPNHLIFTPEEEKFAKDLSAGQQVLTKGQLILNEDQMQLAIGSILGDGSLRSNGINTQLRIGHGPNQTEYCKHKQSFFGKSVGWSGENSKGGWSFDLHPSYDLTEIFEESYSKSGRTISPKLLKLLSLQSVAVWYMDDGTFSGHYKRWGNGKSSISVKKYSWEDIAKLTDRLVELGLPEPRVDKHKRLTWHGEASYRFQKMLAPNIFSSMKYKIHPSLRETPEEERQIFQTHTESKLILVPTTITDIQAITKHGKKFDIEVEGNHNYFAGGMLVHNSPEVTSGGNALKFYASQRLDIRRIGQIKDKDKVLGNRTRVKVVKNKLAPPFKEAEFDIRFGIGVDQVAEILDIGVDDGIIEKSGAWYSYKDNKIAQGKENAAQYLRDNPDIQKEIHQQLMELRGLECATKTSGDQESSESES
jgi:recombination protein RecA